MFRLRTFVEVPQRRKPGMNSSPTMNSGQLWPLASLKLVLSIYVFSKNNR